MSGWTLLILVDGVEKKQIVSAADLDAAWAQAELISDEVAGSLRSVSMIDPSALTRAAGVDKLVSLGLTENEAAAVAGVEEITPA